MQLDWLNLPVGFQMCEELPFKLFQTVPGELKRHLSATVLASTAQPSNVHLSENLSFRLANFYPLFSK